MDLDFIIYKILVFLINFINIFLFRTLLTQKKYFYSDYNTNHDKSSNSGRGSNPMVDFTIHVGWKQNF